MRFQLLMILWLVFVPAAPESDGVVQLFDISGIISNYKPGKGLYLALYTSEENFREGKYYKTLRFSIGDLPADSVTYCFSGIEPGEYMIACFQDIDDNGKINSGLFGRPSEPYCFYRPYKGIFRPRFNDCKFSITGSVRDANLRF